MKCLRNTFVKRLIKRNIYYMTERKIAVIGAGPCGLPACKALAERGLAYECFEASDSVGGVWNIERGGGGYRSLHTNTSPR
ncbi:MAG: NAD(P)-binding protein, partial [Pseudomonadales bacterium]